MKNVKKVLVLCVSLALSGVATATTTWTSWTLATDSVVAGGSASANGTATTVTAQGWANTAGSSNTLESQNLRNWPGVGIINKDDPTSYTGTDPNDSVAPWHAIDNNVRQEMVLLSFKDGAVNLQSAGFSYLGTEKGQDGGYTVLAYTGSGAPTLSGLSSWSSLPSSWITIASVGTSSSYAPTFANNTYSSYWLIGASLSGTSGNNDAFKLASVGGCATAKSGVAQSTQCGGGGNSNNVPEPGSLALLGLGLFGMIRMRKVRKT